jgi:hypothetical protein
VSAAARRFTSVPSGSVAISFVVYAAVATSFAPWTWPMRVATAIPIAAVLALALGRGRHRRQPAPVRPVDRRTQAVAFTGWLVLIAIAVSFQLALYRSQPRDTYPTLSSLAAEVFTVQPLRAAAFALWLWLAWYFLER